MPQSMVPSSIIAARRCSCGSRRGWTVTPSGMVTWDSAIRLTTSWEIAVFTATGNSCAVCAGVTGATAAGDVAASRTSANTFSSWPWKSWRACSASSSVMSPRPMRDSVYSLRTERFLSIRSYISGCVNAGLSDSLWPRRR